LGERFGAEQAQEYGIVNKVLPQSEYLEFAMNQVKALAALPADAVQTSKALIKRGVSDATQDAISIELKQFSRLLQSDDAQTIMQAFLNKRKSG